MPNKIFDQILVEEIEIFMNSFSNVSKKMFINGEDESLIHAGEFGMYREALVKRFLRFFIPPKLEIDQGFLINSTDDVSTQCDVVIYDKNYTPLIRSNELQRFYPVETVCAVGEVKSNVSFTALKTALIKLYKSKEMSTKVASDRVIRRSYPGDYNPEKISDDRITTFLICQKLDFKLDRLTEIYDEDTDPKFMHNMILSLEDGLILYSNTDKDGKPSMHLNPTWDGITQNDLSSYRFETGGIDCIKIFCNLLFNATTFRSIVLPEILSYMIYPSN